MKYKLFVVVLILNIIFIGCSKSNNLDDILVDNTFKYSGTWIVESYSSISEDEYNEAEDLTGKEVVVVGRSNIVGKPVALLCLQKNATVTIAHSKTKNLKEVCQRADVLIAAVGRAKMINSDYVKEGAVVLDVGINRDENNKLCGDVDFEDVKDKVYAITPVPGGIGPMTITMLLQNTLEAFYHHQGE